MICSRRVPIRLRTRQTKGPIQGRLVRIPLLPLADPLVQIHCTSITTSLSLISDPSYSCKLLNFYTILHRPFISTDIYVWPFLVWTHCAYISNSTVSLWIRLINTHSFAVAPPWYGEMQFACRSRDFLPFSPSRKTC